MVFFSKPITSLAIINFNLVNMCRIGVDRLRHSKKTDTTVIEGSFGDYTIDRGDHDNPVLPVRLKSGDMFNFSCHRGVSVK